MAKRSSLFPLFDQLLDGKLEQRLAVARAQKLSFDDIAHDLRAEGVHVTGETVRRWCKELGIPTERQTA